MNTFINDIAQAARVNIEELKEQVSYFKALQVLREAFDATNIMVAILNSSRQIVYANKEFIKKVGGSELQDVVGKRPGEAMSCRHAHENELGCGAAEACRSCMAFRTFITSLQFDDEATNEAVIVKRENGFDESMNFQVHVVPFHSENEVYYIVSFIDSTDKVKRRYLERVFFHDVINTAGAIKSYIGLLKEELPAELKAEMEFLEEAFRDMLGEINEQKQLLEAENGELVPGCDTINSMDLLGSVKKLYERNDFGRSKEIILDGSSQAVAFDSDYHLLRRVLSNMLKNALEESEEGDIVRIGSRLIEVQEEKLLEFWVNNKKYIPEEIQYQIFTKSFTTKGKGRGLGTYSMKLLGERYLKGAVGYASEKTMGTTFYIRLPITNNL